MRLCKRKLLMNAFSLHSSATAHSFGCAIVADNGKINMLHERCLRIVYKLKIAWFIKNDATLIAFE